MKAPFLSSLDRRRLRKALARLRADRKRRGVALVLVLGALAILTVMLTEVQEENSAEFSAALVARDQLAAEYAAKSGVNLTRLLIAAEPTIRTSLAPILMMAGMGQAPQIPVWNFTDRVLGAFNDKEGRDSFASFSGLDMTQGEHLGLEGASFEVLVVDEDSKINVNQGARSTFAKHRLMQQLVAMMQSPEFDGLFSERDADGQFSDRQAICSAIIDWADSDQDMWPCDGSDTAQQTAPEDSFYERLDQPYPRKNAPYDSLLELYRVRGVGEDYYANFVDPDPDDPKKRFMTVWGQDKINVNGAPPEVLLALICSQAAEPLPKACDYGEGSVNFLTMMRLLPMLLMGAPAFSSGNDFVQTLKGEGLKGQLLKSFAGEAFEPITLKSEKEMKDITGTESKVFSIYARGFVRAGKRETSSRVQAVVDFRAAPPPGEARTVEQLQDQASALTDESQQAAAEQAIQAALKPSPAGNIVYYRMD
jgi:general secretion pathway protein K